MKLRKSTTKLKSNRPELIALIGLVFQLLTFFIIVINFESTKADERSKLPKDMLAKPPSVRPEYELVLNLGYEPNELGQRTGSTPVVFFEDRNVDVRQIAPELEREKQLIERTQGRDAMREVTVTIRGDSQVPAGVVQELVRKCQEAGFSKFSLHTVAGGRE